MNDIWTLTNIYLYAGVIGTLLYIVKILLYFVGGGDSDADLFDGIGETDISFNFLSVQSILAFLMGFGWCGFSAFVQFQTNELITFVIAFAAGLFCMFLSGYLMFTVKKLTKTVKVDLNELKDKTGRSYTSFKSKSQGQIEIDLNGRLSILEAYNMAEEDIPAFSEITVVKIEDNRIYIKRK